jgi:hypothetical protein
VPLNYLLFGGKDSLKINSDKLEDLLLAVSNVIKKHNIELTAPEQAKLITHLYVEIPNNEKASEKNIYKLISIFK